MEIVVLSMLIDDGISILNRIILSFLVLFSFQTNCFCSSETSYSLDAMQAFDCNLHSMLFSPLASTCEFPDIVELLLKFGADPTLRDTEGYLPEEVTDCRIITSMLQKHTAGKT